MSKEDFLFSIFHPIGAIRARVRQVGVAIEHASPPPGSSIEDYPNLSVKEAARLLKGGVPLSAWSKSDQERLACGERPVGHPEHPNV